MAKKKAAAEQGEFAVDQAPAEKATEQTADESFVIKAEVKGGHVVAYNQTEAALAELKERYGDLSLFNVTTAEGMESAKAGRKVLVKYRTSLEDRRKELKAPVQAMGKLIDDEAKRITARLQEIELPLAKLIDDEEARLKAIKDAEERKEAERKQAIQDRLQLIRNLPAQKIGKSADELRSALAWVQDIDCATFAEFWEAAAEYKETALEQLETMLAIQEQAERQAEELAKLRAQLAAAAPAAQPAGEAETQGAVREVVMLTGQIQATTLKAGTISAPSIKAPVTPTRAAIVSTIADAYGLSLEAAEAACVAAFAQEVEA